MNYETIPVALLSGLTRYVNDRIATGGFLRAVLENDLFGAHAKADPDSLAALPALMRYIYNEVEPGTCWGSPEAVAAWLAEKPS